MKYRILVTTLVCAGAGLLGWYMNPPAAESAAKPAAEPAKSPAHKSATVGVPALPVHAPQVAEPAVAVANPGAANTPSAPAPADPTSLQPQSDLAACLTQSIKLLQAHDIASLIKTLMLPDEMKSMMQSTGAATPEELEVILRQKMPDMDSRMDVQLQAMQQIQGQTPTLSPDGNTATYKWDAPAGYDSELTFVKVDGNWYLR